MQPLTQENFSKAVNTNFKVKAGEDELNFKLDKVSDIKSIGAGFESYDLTFTCPKEKGILDQQTLEMEHEDMGSVNIFVVPVEEKDDQVNYQAVFNYKAQEEEFELPELKK